MPCWFVVNPEDSIAKDLARDDMLVRSHRDIVARESSNVMKLLPVFAFCSLDDVARFAL